MFGHVSSIVRDARLREHLFGADNLPPRVSMRSLFSAFLVPSILTDARSAQSVSRGGVGARKMGELERSALGKVLARSVPQG